MTPFFIFETGDWVLFQDKPCKINRKFIFQDVSGYFPSWNLKRNENDLFGINTWVCEIKPLPLTDEILEKNGIKKSSLESFIINEFNIRFVHELQRLRKQLLNGEINGLEIKDFLIKEIVI